MERDHVGDIFDEVVGQLADVDKAVGLHSEVDESPEGGDVGDDAREAHADGEVVDGVHGGVEGEVLELLTGVATGFFEFCHYVAEGGESNFVADVVVEVDLFALGGVGYELCYGAVGVVCHLGHYGVSFGVDG